MSHQWNPSLYSHAFSFIPQLGSGLIDMLSLSAHDTVLDVGCGIGELTNELAKRCHHVVAIDSSETMIQQAQLAFPTLDFRCGNALDFKSDIAFDAILSNATLHWVKPAEIAVQNFYALLKQNGKLAVEFGGKHNVETIVKGVQYALDTMGKQECWTNSWYFPSLGEYSSLLESVGFRVQEAIHFDRPTPMHNPEDGLANWVSMFIKPRMNGMSDSDYSEFLRLLDAYCRPILFKNGDWIIDYVRLRVLAVK